MADRQQRAAKGYRQLAANGFFESRELRQSSVDEPRRYLRRRRFRPEDSLTHAGDQLDREQPEEEVTASIDLKPRTLRQIQKALLRVPGEVLVDVVMIGPEELEGGDGDHKSAIGFEKSERVAHCLIRVLQMLQDIQHQDGGVPVRRRKALVKRANVNTPTVSPWTDQCAVRFDALNLAKFR